MALPLSRKAMQEGPPFGKEKPYVMSTDAVKSPEEVKAGVVYGTG